LTISNRSGGETGEELKGLKEKKNEKAALHWIGWALRGPLEKGWWVLFGCKNLPTYFY